MLLSYWQKIFRLMEIKKAHKRWLEKPRAVKPMVEEKPQCGYEEDLNLTKEERDLCGIV